VEIIVVVFIVCLAVGYLAWRYVKRAKNVGVCECESMECPLKSAGSVPLENQCRERVCENNKRKP